MCKKLLLQNEKITEIRNLYLKEKKTTKEISRLIKISDTVICKTLKEHNSYINTNDIDKSGFKKGDLQKEIDKRKDLLLLQDFIIKENIKEEDKKNFVAVCKITGKIFKDYKNSSGVLTSHLNEIFPGFNHPSNFVKREYKIKHAKYWHEQYFDLIFFEESKKEKFKCAYCEWETNDLKNKSGCYTIHLKNEHDIIDINNHLEKYPEESFLFKTIIEKSKKKEKVLSDSNNFIECKICGEKLSILSNSHLKKHNITSSDYKLKYSDTVGKDFSERMLKIYNKYLKNNPKKFTLKSQNEIKFFLESKNLKVELNNRKILNGIEIDIFSNEKRIGIEFNGNLFHSEVFGKKDSKYHLNKTVLMNSKDYSLIHIFEDEWELKKDIVKSKLSQIFDSNIDLEKIYARKCEIKKINNEQKEDFLNINHIQGNDNSNIFFGAFYNDKLISVMTFDNKRKMTKHNNDKNSYELSRFATDINYRVIGIAGKFLSHFIKEYNPCHIISFADKRWTLDKDDNLYTKLGFKLTNILRPDYSYYNPKIDRFKRFHKFNFGKKSIKKKYPSVYDDKKTEWEMMQELGFDRIWDCGKFCYELNFKK